MGALIYMVDAGDEGDISQNRVVVGDEHAYRAIRLEEWRGADSEVIGPFASELCAVCISQRFFKFKISSFDLRMGEF